MGGNDNHPPDDELPVLTIRSQYGGKTSMSSEEANIASDDERVNENFVFLRETLILSERRDDYSETVLCIPAFWQAQKKYR